MATKRKEKEIVEKLKEIGITRARLKIVLVQKVATYQRECNKLQVEDAILKFEESQLILELK